MLYQNVCHFQNTFLVWATRNRHTMQAILRMEAGIDIGFDIVTIITLIDCEDFVNPTVSSRSFGRYLDQRAHIYFHALTLLNVPGAP